jgi:hypothetical protein
MQRATIHIVIRYVLAAILVLFPAAQGFGGPPVSRLKLKLKLETPLGINIGAQIIGTWKRMAIHGDD